MASAASLTIRLSAARRLYTWIHSNTRPTAVWRKRTCWTAASSGQYRAFWNSFSLSPSLRFGTVLPLWCLPSGSRTCSRTETSGFMTRSGALDWASSCALCVLTGASTQEFGSWPSRRWTPESRCWDPASRLFALKLCGTLDVRISSLMSVHGIQPCVCCLRRPFQLNHSVKLCGRPGGGVTAQISHHCSAHFSFLTVSHY